MGNNIPVVSDPGLLSVKAV